VHCGIESAVRECVPCPLQNFNPVFIVFREAEFVLDLKVDLRFAAILPDSSYNDVIERLFECGALRLNNRGEFTWKSTDWCLTHNRGNARSGDACFKMRFAPTC
jgi:hypothetical protein